MSRPAIFPRDRVTIVGVLNMTPDSFSDGGRFVQGRGTIDVEAAVGAALEMVRNGAHVIDVGGESTRPGASEVPAALEIERTVGVIEALAKNLTAPVSIDTRKAEVAEVAIAAGATIVNDVSGLAFDPAIADVAARADATVVLGHLRGTPETMQEAPHFDDVLEEVATELAVSVARAERAGIAEDAIVVDPGIGFGKRLEDNLALLANAGWLGRRLGRPVLVGPSRKSFLRAIPSVGVADRDESTAAACAVSIFAGADAVRVHDVAGAKRAAAVAWALRGAAGAAS